MADKPYVLGPEAVRQIQRDHQTIRHQLRKMNEHEAEGRSADPSKGGGGRRREFLTGITTTEVTRASEASGRPTFGTGKVKLHNVTLAANTGAVFGTDAGWADVDVFNMGPEIPENYPVFLWKCFQTGQWLVNDWSHYFSQFVVTVEITPAEYEEETRKLGFGQGTALIKDNDGVTVTDTGAMSYLYNCTDSAIPVGTICRAVRDPVTLDYIVESASITDRPVSFVKAQGYWTRDTPTFPSTRSDIDANVSVKRCDKDGTVNGAAFWCYLPSTNTGHDPNVVPGQIFTAAETKDPSDDASSWTALSGHEDAAIGTVRMFARNDPAGPELGWAEMNGVDNAAPKGSGIDMTGAVPKNDCSATPGTSNSGDADPSTQTTSTTPGASATEIGETDSSGELTTDAAGGTTGSGGSHTHATGSHSHSFSDTSSSSSGTTGGSGTLTTSTHTIDTFWVEEVTMYTETVAGFASLTDDDEDGEVDDYTHYHTVPSHTHSTGSHTHYVSGTTGSSSGSTSSAGSHTHSVGSHVHQIATHTHTIPALAVPGVSHRHDIEVQKTKTLCFFERIDNADWS